jgi:hypothetical protein
MNANQVDRLVQRAEERAKAARQLRDIWTEHPDLFTQFVDSCGQNGSAPKAGRQPVKGKRESTARMVLNFIRLNPASTAAEVADAIVDGVQTTMDNPKKAIYASLATLKRHKKLSAETDDDGAQRYTVLKK